MELNKQTLLLSYLVSSNELFVKVSPILQSKYFDPRLKNTISFVQRYYDEYKAAPNPEQIKAETNLEIQLKDSLTRQELKYAEAEIETFCQEKAIEHAIMMAPALLADGKKGDIQTMLRDALTISLHRDIGLDYFQDPEGRLKSLCLNNAPIPTRFLKLDEYLGGGIARKELIIVAGIPGGGKSLTLANLAKNLMSQGLNGVYITLELAQEVVAKRFDSMFSGLSQQEILKNITQTTIEINKSSDNHGRLFIKRMRESSTNANHIRAYLKEFEIVNGFTPDFIVVDYMDLMCSVQSISAENTFSRDKFISEELRSIADDLNLVMLTASQLNRGAQQLDNPSDDLSQAHIAGGISKANTADTFMAIIQTPQMKARGEMMYKLLKTRSSNGVGHSLLMLFDPITLTLKNPTIDEEDNRSSKNLSNYIRGKVAKTDITEKNPDAKPLSSKLSVTNLPFQV